MFTPTHASRRSVQIITAMIVASAPAGLPSFAAETGFSMKVITFGEDRERLQATPIEQRPYRPLHVYGNTIRRRHQRESQPQAGRLRSSQQSSPGAHGAS